MKNLWNTEPTMILAVIQAGMAMAMGFGLHLTTEQMGLTMAFLAALIGMVNRGQVHSPSTVEAIKQSIVDIKAGNP